jgi:hypothetical protein
MNTDISEQAKQAIANGRLVRARARLVKDGCQTDAALHRRLFSLVAERNLPPAEYAKLLHKRIMTQSVMDFCKKHDVSLDWLLCGDLKGLQRMKAWKKAGMTPEERRAEIARLVLLLPLDLQQPAIDRLRQMTEGLPNAL